MKPISLGVIILTLAFVSSGWSADVVPKKANFNRYQAIQDHFPFALATAALGPGTPKFAKDLYLANLVRSPEGCTITITLASVSDKNFKEYLTTRGPNEHGYTIDGVDWCPVPPKQE